MGDLLKNVVPLALGAAFSPTLLTVLVIILGAPLYPRARGTAFAAGAAGVLAGITAVSLLVMSRPVTGTTHHQTFYGWVNIVIAVLLVLLAIKEIVRPRVPKPQTVESSDTGPHVRRFIGIGALMMTVNFSTIVIYLPAMREISTSTVSTMEQAMAVVIAFLIATVTLWFPVGLYAIKPSVGRRLLEPVDRFLTLHARVITVGVCLIFAVYLGLMGARDL